MPIRKTTGTLHLFRGGKRVVIAADSIFEISSEELAKVNRINPNALITLTEEESDKWLAMEAKHKETVQAQSEAAAQAAAQAEADARAKVAGKQSGKPSGKAGTDQTGDEEL